jgi:hypothetical protein
LAIYSISLENIDVSESLHVEFNTLGGNLQGGVGDYLVGWSDRDRVETQQRPSKRDSGKGCKWHGVLQIHRR